MNAWYALYTKPKQEYLVLEQLQQRGVEAFFPQFVERRRGEERVRALFPNYLFVRVDLAVVGQSLLRWTPGLRGVVSFAGVPAHVPDEAIALVRKQLARLEAAGGFPKARFKPGERVRVTEGPLAGLEAVFQGPGPAERVRILIRFLGQANRAVVPKEALEKVAERRHPPRRTRGRGRRIKSQVEGSRLQVTS
jgi:transcriptional antiterminator RfaH